MQLQSRRPASAFFNDFIEDILPSAVNAFILLIINGIILIFTKKIPVKDRKLDEMGLIRSIGTGLFQAVAILPGISRPGMTITGGMASGLVSLKALFALVKNIKIHVFRFYTIDAVSSGRSPGSCRAFSGIVEDPAARVECSR